MSKKFLLFTIASAAVIVGLCTLVAYPAIESYYNPNIPIPHLIYPTFADDMRLSDLKLMIDEEIERNDLAKGTTLDTRSLDVLKLFSEFLGKDPTARELQDFIEKNFNVFRKHDVLYTGYYVPTINGSLTRTEQFKYPIYAAPAGRHSSLPTRRQIDKDGVLKGKNLELAWTDDYLELFLLHIQGSGRVSVNENMHININCDRTNNRPYVGIGSLLIKEEKLEKKSLTVENIRNHFKAHPEDLEKYLLQNERYVFFRKIKDKDFPRGSMGIPLKPNRSIAADFSHYPKGALLFIKAEKPIFDENGVFVKTQRFSRFVLNQDSGAAIKGPRRVDIFMGEGRDAKQTAESTKNRGSVYIFTKK